MPAPQVLPRWPVPVLLVAAVCVFVATGLLAAQSWRIARHGEVAEGEVVDVDYFGSESGLPLVAFEAGARSVSVRLANPLGRGYDLGDRVRMRYDPDHPERALRDSFDGLYAQAMIAGGVGLMLVAVTIVYAVLRRRAAPRATVATPPR